VQALLTSPSLGLLVPTDRHAEVAAEVVSEIPTSAGISSMTLRQLS